VNLGSIPILPIPTFIFFIIFIKEIDRK
jgi:hypothetical protein